MRKIAATYIFTPQNELIKNGILVCEDDGTIIELQKSNKNIAEQSGLEYYSGILVPGFVNTHCHLELSHFNNKIEENCGISSFLEQVNRLRKLKPDKSEILLHHFDRKMWASGIAAVGDISNSTDTLIAKQKSKIYYHTFIETFGFHPSRAERAYEIALKVKEEFDFNGLSNSIVPHSAHSVSKPLFSKIIEHAHNYNSIISIHNQESSAENLFFKSGSGPIVDYFQNTLNLDISHWKPTGKSSIHSIIEFIPATNQLILVHNTFTEKSDIDELKKRRNLDNTFFTLCPNSNLFIENQLPPVELFQDENLTICVGTDSLASNRDLSILSELITLQLHFSEILIEDLISWATINGARALGIDGHFGSFAPNKKPGINLITGIDFKTRKFTQKSKLKRLG